MTLKDLVVGENAVIESVGGEGALRQHFLDMGIIPGTEITVIKYAPMGDPMEIRLHGYELTLRLDDATKISVRKTGKKTGNKSGISGSGIERDARRKEPEGPAKNEHLEIINREAWIEGGKSFALVGNQNSGKTTLFNRLTGANQHVGNFPGVTVDKKTGSMKGYPDIWITDLPGIYSMSPYSGEELVSRNFVLDENPGAIINIVDATNMERNLYLTMQLLDLDIPMVVALNMMDELTENGGYVNLERMEKLLGVPVVSISAAKNEGIDELVEQAVYVARLQRKPKRRESNLWMETAPVYRCMQSVFPLIREKAIQSKTPIRFAAAKVIEGDERIFDRLGLDQSEKEAVERIVLQMEKERGLDRSAAMADIRFSYIRQLCAVVLKKPTESKERIRSEKADRILTGKYTAIPALIGIMAFIFYLTFHVIGARLQELFEIGIETVSKGVDRWLAEQQMSRILRGFLIDGIFAGVGSVISFLPIIVTLFFFLSLLEDSGYMARVAFVMDKPFRKAGLSGRSIVPLLIGFGCSVPAVMAARTLPSERDRKVTVLLTPFMSCTAKLPIYAFFVNRFFPQMSGEIITGLYVCGILMGILAAFLYRRVLFEGEEVSFVMELPNYRMPSAKNVGRLLWEKSKDFLHRAFSVILLATVVIWVLKSFDIHLHFTLDSQESILAKIAGIFVPVMRPIGLGDWRICVSLISGFMAKESVVSTMEILFGGDITMVISPISAASLLVFSLLYTPCIAAVASVRRELGTRWAVGMVVWQCVIAWIAAFFVRGLGMLMGISG